MLAVVMINPNRDRRVSQRYYRLKVTAWTLGLVATIGLIAAAIW